MKILISNQEYFATLGISRHHAVQCQRFNAKALLNLLVFGLGVISCNGFLCYEAKIFKDYTESIYFTSANLATATIFLIIIWNKEKFFDFVDGWEKCVEES